MKPNKQGYATKRIRKEEINIEAAERFNPKFDEGLTNEQVQSRIDDNLVNIKPKSTTKTNLEIVRDNFLSFFNILLYIIAGAMIAVGYFKGLLFVLILLLNTFLGLIQDIRAKKTLEKLSILTEQKSKVIREGQIVELSSESLVLDDIILLKLGDQIPADGVVIHGSIKANESLLTGESTLIDKEVGDTVLSGSFVTSGTAYYRINLIGKLGYAQTIQIRAKSFKRPKSELLGSINGLFKIIGGIVISIGVLMILVNIYQELNVRDNVVSVSGSMVGMIPSGMYLLTSMTLAFGVIRLGKKDTLVQEMYSIEMLARVDVLCLDKTGTLTDGSMNVEEVHIINKRVRVDLDTIISDFLLATGDDNSTAKALKEYFKGRRTYEPLTIVPFSSEAKYSAATFTNGETYVLGATTSVLDKEQRKEILAIEQTYTNRGMRVVVLARSKKKIINGKNPTDLVPVALIALQDSIRKEAVSAIKWFTDNGVKVKIISGDDPSTVAEISRNVGVENSQNYLDLSDIDEDTLRQKAFDTTVFGRVKPEQKEIIIRQLQKQGMTVAMIGDGVNDVLALKAADCSIAMSEGSSAARGVAHLIIKQNFDALPSIVDEGRRAINNLQQTWSLFLVKTTFTIIMSLIFLFAGLLAPLGSGIGYPFSTQNLYIWELVSIGLASLALSLQPNKAKIKGTFISNVIRKALPSAGVMVLAVLSFYFMKTVESVQPGTLRVNDANVAGMAVITISFLSFVVLLRTILPLNKFRSILFVFLVLVGIGFISLDRFGSYNGRRFDLFDIGFQYFSVTNYVEIVVVNVLAIVGYHFLLRAINKGTAVK